MKTSWKIKPLGEVATIIAGQSPPGDSYNAEGKGTPFYQGKKDYGVRFLLPPTVWTTNETKIAEAGDLLISVRAPVGALNFATQRICIGRGLAAIRTDSMLPDFLYYALSNLSTSITGKEGAVFASISKTDIEKIIIPVLPFSEQKRIVGILDAAFEKIDKLQCNAERNYENAKELFQQVLDEEMIPKSGWKKSMLKDVSQGITDGDHLPPPKEAKGISFITISNITDQQKIDFSSTFFVSQNYYNNLATIRKAQYGDILYTVTGSYGIPVLIDFNKQFCFQRHIAIIRPNIELIDPLFLSFLLESNEIKKQADSTATGVAQKTVSLTALRKFVLFFPSLNDQKAIAKKLMYLKNKTFEIKDKYTNIKSNCAELKQQVLSSAFNGEL